MAAFETPWMTEMSSASAQSSDNPGGSSKNDSLNPPTIAAFSPVQHTTSPTTKQRSTILVHQKSPLLVATPPAVTRALAFSHPFILPLNKIVGLLTWTSGDPWESFLVVAVFWAIGLYGDIAIQYAGPVILVIALILLMYSRRYSPLSSTGWTGEKSQHARQSSEGGMKHQKSLDEIVETLNIFTSRCNLLLEPFLQLTEFLSTQRTATSATTRPALTSLFIRILFGTPVWIGLTFPPLYLLTVRRCTLASGTIVLSWYSRPARVTRTLLWRSRMVRRVFGIVTGLTFANPEIGSTESDMNAAPLPPRQKKNQRDIASSLLSTKGNTAKPGVRFTFSVYENQRRWLGLGWTYSLLAYERAAWTDDHLNPSDSKDDFELPEVETGTAEWRWVEGSEWKIDHGGKGKTKGGDDGWIYYDNKWHDGRRGQDGWGKYTRRRKWYRDAELVEVDPEAGLLAPTDAVKGSSGPDKASDTATTSGHRSTPSVDGSESIKSQTKRRGFFRRRNSGRSVQSSSDISATTTLRNEDDENHVVPPQHERTGDWNVGDDVKMGLG